MSNPWDVAPMLPKGDDNETDVFLAVGRALTAWEQLETGLFELYQILAHSTNFASEAAYGSIASSEARTEMIRAAAKRMLPPRTLSTTTEKLYRTLKDIGNFTSRRNDIAHGQVMRIGDSGSYLTHSFYNSRKLKPGNKSRAINAFERYGFSYAYTSAQIENYAMHFIRQKSAVQAVAEEIRELRDPKNKP